MRASMLSVAIVIFAFGLVAVFLFNLPQESSDTGGLGIDNPGGLISGTSGDGGDKPVLKNLGIDFESWDVTKTRTGEYTDRFLLAQNKPLIEFGTRVMGEQQRPKLLPEITYVLPRGTKVISPVSGRAELGVIEWSGDYSITIKEDDSEWVVTLEHVKRPGVKDGDPVESGQIIGEVSTADLEGTGFGFVELSVWKGGATTKDIVKICPFTALQDDLKPMYEKRIRNLVVEWEESVGEGVYNESSWVYPACLFKELTESEALNGAKVS